MESRGVEVCNRDVFVRQVERVAASHLLHGSDALCKLLRFLVLQSLDRPGEPIKEYQIATQLFGRTDDFDPRIDASIRVQIGRLRSKLIEYYATEGLSDRLVIEIPKGAYTPILHDRTLWDSERGRYANGFPPYKPPERPRFAREWATAVLGTLLLFSTGIALGFWLRTAERTSAATGNAVLREFWRPFVNSNETVVVFSNALFVGRPDTGLRYFDPARDKGDAVLDHYTGIGEVFAINQLDRLFQGFHSSMLLKRGQLLNWDDAKDRNVIFVGAPSENLHVGELGWNEEFEFRLKTDSNGPRFVYIEDLHPKSGGSPAYFASSENPLLEDYAVISLKPTPNGKRWMMLAAGTTTLGTQGAVEYLCSPSSIPNLWTQLHTKSTVPFAGLLRVQIKGGVPVASELVALRPLGKLAN